MSENEKELAVLVCGHRGKEPLGDNVAANCASCGCNLVHRPIDLDADPHLEGCIKLCLGCAMLAVGEARKAGIEPELGGGTGLTSRGKQEFLDAGHTEEEFERASDLSRKMLGFKA